MSKSKQIAAGGIASSLCLLTMFLTGVFPFATYALPAIAGTLPAVAMAVLAMMAAAPISMASQACEGRPIPASTIMGRSISLIRI